MSQILLESDFLTVNLVQAFKNAPKNVSTDEASDETAASAEPGENSTESELTDNTVADFGSFSWDDWNEEFASRKEKNAAMSKEAQIPVRKLEDDFFKDFFTNKVELKPIAKQLMLLGETFRKVLRVFGLNPSKNALLAFLLLPEIQKNMLQTGLLNSNTFSAIVQAVSSKYIAGSCLRGGIEYAKSNILYCPDLYKKSRSEIVEYLRIQNDVLPFSADKHTAAALAKNRRIFFVVPEVAKEANVSARAKLLKKIPDDKLPVSGLSSTKLNSVKWAEALKSAISGNSLQNNNAVSRDGSISHLDDKQIATILNKMDSKEEKLALLFYIGTTTDNEKAKQALASGVFKSSVNGDLIAKAANRITTVLPNGRLTKSNIDALVNAILESVK